MSADERADVELGGVAAAADPPPDAAPKPAADAAGAGRAPPAAATESAAPADADVGGVYSRRMGKATNPLTLTWHGITYKVLETKKKGAKAEKGSFKTILDNVSGEAAAGKLTAIMGPSGAGKTSLLNSIVGRNAAGCTGQMRINGQRFTATYWQRVKGYVWQSDVLFPHLTVRETLLVSARLRLPGRDVAEKRQLVQDVIDELGLQGCADTVVGNQMVKGISGGEAKRLSIGVEMITNPRLLLLDEPTTGLDASTALKVVSTLKALARQGRTVVFTIHQPRSNIVELFDSIILMGKGRVAYAGPAAGALDHFAALGHALPPRTNPADFYLDVLAPELDHAVALADAWAATAEARRQRELPAARDASLLDRPEAGTGGASFWTQLSVLTWRASRNAYRDLFRTWVRVAQSMVFALIVGLIFFRLGRDQTAIIDRTGVLYFIILNQSFGSMFPILVSFTAERDVFRKERSEGYYGVTSFFLSKLFVELPMSLIPVVFGVVVYYVVGLNSAADAFVRFLLIVFLAVFAVEGLGFVIASVSRDIQIAQIIAPVAVIVAMLLGGFLISIDSLPVWLRWAAPLSFFKHSYAAAMVNEFTDATFTCTAKQEIEVPGVNGTLTTVCPVTTGEQVLAIRGFDDENYWESIAYLALLGLAFRALTYVVLRVFVKDKSQQRLGEQ